MSKSVLLPSGKLATRFFSHGEVLWQLPTRSSEDWITLVSADIKALAEAAGFNVESNDSESTE